MRSGAFFNGKEGQDDFRGHQLLSNLINAGRLP